MLYELHQALISLGNAVFERESEEVGTVPGQTYANKVNELLMQLLHAKEILREAKECYSVEPQALLKRNSARKWHEDMEELQKYISMVTDILDYKDKR